MQNQVNYLQLAIFRLLLVDFDITCVSMVHLKDLAVASLMQQFGNHTLKEVTKGALYVYIECVCVCICVCVLKEKRKN